MDEGGRVRLGGLAASPRLNGALGTVAGRQGDRVVVVLDATGTVRAGG